MPASLMSSLPKRRRLAWQVAVLLALLCAYRMVTFGTPAREGFDETVYAYYAEVLVQDGVAGLRQVLERWADHPQLRLGPLPLRIAYIGATAVAVRWLTGEGTLAPAVVSSLCGMLLLLAGYGLARRWMRPSAALMAVLLLAGSPLATGLSRRGLQDTMFALVVTLALWLFDRALASRHGRDALLCGLALFAGFLTKESMLFMYPMLLVIALLRVPVRDWFRHLPLMAACVLAPAAALLVMLALAGSPELLWNVYRAYGRMQQEIPYALQYQRGPWFRYLVDFMLIAPGVMLLAGCSLLPGRSGFRAGGARLAAGVLLAGGAVFACLPLLNIRLVLFLDVPLRMLAVSGAGGLAAAATASPVWRPRLTGGLIALAAVLDVLAFRTIFVAGQVYDPITINLIRALGFVN